MDSKKFDVIMFCMSEWQEWKKLGVVNRNRYILKYLQNNKNVNKILVVDFLPYTKKRALRSYFDNQLLGEGGKVIKRGFTSRLRQISNNFFVYSTIDSALSDENKVYKKINTISKSLKFQNIILWSYFPMFCGYFKEIDAELKIFDTVDNWIEHPNFTEYKERLKSNYDSIDKNSDIIFTVSEDLLKLYPTNKNIYWIPNGVDVEKFNVQSSKLKVKNNDLINIKKPIIGYVGIIQNRVDMELIKYIAKQNPDKSIVLIGTIWPDANIESIKNIKNIFLLGHKSYQELPNYLHQFDVSIIPHKINKFTKSMNPMKLYEYLACGKPIVTTPIAGLDKFKNLIEIASTKEGFNNKISKALKEDSKELKINRIETAKMHSWQSRVNQMFEHINNFKK